MTLEEIERETKTDPVLSKLLHRLKSGNLNRHLMNQDPELKPYVKISDEFSLMRNVIVRGDRIVIPKTLIKRALRLSHEGHQGIVKTKQFLRSLAWFLGMSSIIEKYIGKCRPCQASVNTPVQEPVKSTDLPDHPWQYVDVDFLGPLPSGDYVMVVIDEYTRFPEVFITKSTSLKPTISNLDKLFSSYGIPERVKSDNGPPFKSRGFKQFARRLGFKHRRITPRHPRANGLVENFNRMIIKILKIARMECLPWREELRTFLRNYRATIHLSTGKSPAELFFGNRPFKTRMGFVAQSKFDDDTEVRVHDAKQKLKSKQAADKKLYVKECNLSLGDKVLVRMEKRNKLSPIYDPIQYTVVDRKGSMITAERQKPFHSITRDMSHFKKLKYSETIYDFEDFVDNNNTVNEAEEVIPLRRSERSSRPPVRYPANDLEK